MPNVYVINGCRDAKKFLFGSFETVKNVVYK